MVLIFLALFLLYPLDGTSFEYVNRQTNGSYNFKCITNSIKRFNIKKLGSNRYMVTGGITKVVYGSSYENIAYKICNN